MARKPRIVVPECVHHVTQRGNNRQVVFCDDQDRRRYFTLLREHSSREGVTFTGYCLMTNHVHLLVTPLRSESLAQFFRRAHAEYAQWFNWRHGRSGHLWQNRYYSCILSQGHLWRALRYVERNPVRAGLVSRAQDWPWSSARAHCDLGRSDLPITLEDWSAAYTVNEWQQWLCGEQQSETEALRECTLNGWALGEEEFVKLVELRVGRPVRPLPRGRPRNSATGKSLSAANSG